MRNRSTAKKIFYSLLGAFVVIAAAVWIFYTYYFQDALNESLIGKLQASIEAATHGQYRLSIGRVVYKDGAMFCTNFVLRRVRYGKDETGLTLERLEQDTVYFKGLHLVSLLRGNGSFMSRMEMRSPNIYITDIADGRKKLEKLPFDTSTFATKLPDDLPVISFDSVFLDNMRIYVPEKLRLAEGDSIYEGGFAHLGNFQLDSAAIASAPLLFSKYVEVYLPKMRYDMSDGVYSLEAGPIHAQLSDSLILIDSASITPKYNEEEFGEHYKYLRGRITFRSSNIRIEGLGLEGLMEGESLKVRKCMVGSWKMDYYSDKRKPREPHPQPAVLPNELVQELQLPMSIDSFVLDNGKVRIRERAPGSTQAGVLTFDHAKIIASPYCNDTASSNYGKATHVYISALFLDEASVSASIEYELEKSELEMNIEAKVGKLNAKKLNVFLIPNERKELTGGTIDGGSLRMKIHNGIATTTVTPQYEGLSMKILPQVPGQSGGLLNGIKSFLANLFILRASNFDKDDIKAVSATTTRRRDQHEELLQFIWYALRKSLGKVIGGFE